MKVEVDTGLKIAEADTGPTMAEQNIGMKGEVKTRVTMIEVDTGTMTEKLEPSSQTPSE